MYAAIAREHNILADIVFHDASLADDIRAGQAYTDRFVVPHTPCTDACQTVTWPVESVTFSHVVVSMQYRSNFRRISSKKA
jgi:hypothetical protein